MKTLIKIILAFLVLAIVGLAIYLLPAHLQVRTVEPDFPNTEQLRALKAVSNGPIKISYLKSSTQDTPQGALAHTAFIIEWANGNKFMIDTAMDEGASADFAEFVSSLTGAGPATFHGSAADLLGSGIQEVSGMGFTHLHADHTQGVIAFCAARGTGVTAFQTHWQKDLQNFNTEEGASIIAASCLEQAVLSGDGMSTLDAYPGLALLGMGGHTPGSTLWLVAVGDTLWLLSGDISNSKANLLSNTGKGFIYSFAFVPEDTERTEAMRLWLSELDAEQEYPDLRFE